MGSFNINCFATNQVMSAHDRCRIFAVRQSLGYEKAVLSKSSDTIYSPMGSICYPNTFWTPITNTVLCKYDDYGKFVVDHTPASEYMLSTVLSSIYDVNADNRNEALIVEDLKNDLKNGKFQETLDTIFDHLQDSRLYGSGDDRVASIKFACMYEGAYQEILSSANKLESYDGTTLDVRSYISRVFDDGGQANSANVDDNKTILKIHRMVDKLQNVKTYESCSYIHVSLSILYDIIENYYTGKITKNEAIDQIAPWLEDKWVLSHLDSYGIKITPIVYAGQDYLNNRGKKYLGLVKIVNDQIEKCREEEFK
jgi:hypothetical protein